MCARTQHWSASNPNSNKISINVDFIPQGAKVWLYTVKKGYSENWTLGSVIIPSSSSRESLPPYYTTYKQEGSCWLDPAAQSWIVQGTMVGFTTTSQSDWRMWVFVASPHTWFSGRRGRTPPPNHQTRHHRMCCRGRQGKSAAQQSDIERPNQDQNPNVTTIMIIRSESKKGSSDWPRRTVTTMMPPAAAAAANALSPSCRA